MPRLCVGFRKRSPQTTLLRLGVSDGNVHIEDEQYGRDRVGRPHVEGVAAHVKKLCQSIHYLRNRDPLRKLCQE